jgi:hypothetical protein
MRKRLKSFCVVITSVFIYLLHLPFAFAKSATGNKLFFHPSESLTKLSDHPAPIISSIKSAYDSLHLDLSGLSQQAFDFAKRGFDKLIVQGRILNDSIISIVDFSQPSNMKRLYILDIKHYKVLFNTLVAHGKNSGQEWANSFSNQPSSFKSSTGFYITGESYSGNNGYSLKLVGIEKGINDNAWQRSIIIHGAGYVNESYIAAQGYIGRSEGCPAVPEGKAVPIINTIKNGTCLFIYHPNQLYLQHSFLLNQS